MIGMCAEILKPEDMHGKLLDGWSEKFDCEDSAVSKFDGQGTTADSVNEEVEAILNDVKALDVISTDILDPGGAGKLLFVSGIWRKLVQSNEDDLDLAHVTLAVDDDVAETAPGQFLMTTDGNEVGPSYVRKGEPLV